ALRRRVRGEHLPGIDADPDLEEGSSLLAVELVDRIAELPRRANGPEGVALVPRGNAEPRHHRVPDEFLDGAAVALDHALRHLEVAAHDGAQHLGIERRT